MSTLKQIRKRIGSVKNTQQITKAMKMVAAAKLRRAQDSVQRARPYADQVVHIVHDLAEKSAGSAHPLLKKIDDPRILELVVFSSDRGLCGGFNSNIIRRAERFMLDNAGRYDEIRVTAIGRRARDHFRRTGKLYRDWTGVLDRPSIATANAVTAALTETFLSGETHEVVLMYSKFISAIRQELTDERLLPVVTPARSSHAEEHGEGVDFIYEPGRDEVLAQLLPKYVSVTVFRAMLESSASEHGARMTAMDSASNNAREMISSLTLQYNRARQAAITKELMEIIGGAEALKD
jgi:F-type H+-transporting ATPase subunit gamma